MSVKETLLKILEDLEKEDNETFKFFLNDRGTLEPFLPIPKSQLEGATRTRLVEIISQTYSQKAPIVVEKILKKIPRNDLVEELHRTIPQSDEADKLGNFSRRDEVDERQNFSRHDEVDDQQQQSIINTSRSTREPGGEMLEQKKKSLSVEVSSEVKALTGAQNTNTLSKYDHITCKELIQSGPPAVYQLIPKKQSVGKNVRKLSLGQRDPNRTNRTILLVGETGAGKSTLVNALVNYAIGVTWEDNVWFETMETEKKRKKCEEQGPDVIVYEILGFEGQTLPFSLTIIDTPGYGDTRGTEQDDKVSQRLLDLFSSKDGVRRINVVGLVLKASENCLSDRLRYIFDSVVSLFGKDLEENIVALITYSFGRTPKNVLEALEDANVKCAKNERSCPVHFLFDKCQNMMRTKESIVTWEIMREGMKQFTDYLKDSEPKKLETTAEVLNARIELKACIHKLQETLQESEEKQKKIQKSLEEAQQEMNNNKEFMEEVEEKSIVKEDIGGGTWGLILFYDGAVCCTVCKETCHYPCTMAWSPYRCNVMANERCTVCPRKCPVSDHVKEKWRYVTETREVKRENADMKKRYERSKAEFESLQNDLVGIQENKDELLKEAFEHIHRLEEIALNTDSLSTLLHLNFLMEQVKERGDTIKIKKLEEMRSRVDKGTRAGLRYKQTAARR